MAAVQRAERGFEFELWIPAATVQVSKVLSDQASTILYVYSTFWQIIFELCCGKIVQLAITKWKQNQHCTSNRRKNDRPYCSCIQHSALRQPARQNDSQLEQEVFSKTSGLRSVVGVNIVSVSSLYLLYWYIPQFDKFSQRLLSWKIAGHNHTRV